MAETNAARFSGRKGNSTKQPLPSTTTVDVPPVFDTSITYADARGRRLFDNMKKENSMRGVRISSSGAGGKDASLNSSGILSDRESLSRSGKLLEQSLMNASRGAAEAKSEKGNFMKATLASSGSHLPPPPPATFASSSQWLLSFRAELQNVIDADKVRQLSLKECRECITAIYESKAAADARAVARGSGGHSSSMSSSNVYHTDTLEMHVYRSLEKKYGLRSLAVDHAAMLLMSVRLHAENEHDIEMFYKIFRNDVEEEFRLVQNELKKSIRDLMMVHLMNK